MFVVVLSMKITLLLNSSLQTLLHYVAMIVLETPTLNNFMSRSGYLIFDIGVRTTTSVWSGGWVTGVRCMEELF